MSTETKSLTPLTMSAEREAEIRKGSFYPALQHPQFYVDAKRDLEKELDAERAAHRQTQEESRASGEGTTKEKA